MKSNTSAFITIHIATTILAMGPVLFRLTDGFETPGYLFWRFLMAIVLFGVFIRGRDLRQIREAPTSKRFILFLSGIVYGLGAWISFEALTHTTVAYAMIAIFTYPVFTAFFQPVFTSQRLRSNDLFASLLVILGIGSMAPITTLTDSDLIGIGLGLISALCFGLEMCLSKRSVTNGFSPSSINLVKFGVLVLCFLPFATSSFPILMNGNLLLVFGAALVTVIGHYAYITCLKLLSPTTVGIVGGLQPIWSAVFAFFLLGEGFTIRIVLAAFILSLAVYVQQKQ